MEEMMEDIYSGNLIACTEDQYKSFVRAAIIQEKDNLNTKGNSTLIKILDAELMRLDVLHLHQRKVA